MVIDVVEDETHADLYVVDLCPADDSPVKLRARLEDALDTLSYNFREYPTLPADAANSLEPLARAYDEACAILLPLKHCTFMGCKSFGDDAIVVGCSHCYASSGSIRRRNACIWNI